MTLARNSMIAHYRVLQQLAIGGMGEVYLAEDVRLGRKVALKLLPTAFTTDADRVRRFVQEAKAASGLNHPNILTIYEIGESADTRYIVTEYIEGETLRRQLERSRPAVSRAVHIAVQVADALAAAHEAGIVHRDIKPENIMLRPDGYVKVLDFGLAKLSDPDQSDAHAPAPTTDAGRILGTVSYMSPEQVRGLAVDTRSDIFSLGVVLYEMLAGRRPFCGESVADVLVAILEHPPAPLTNSAPDVRADLDRVVRKCLEKDRDRRYGVAREVAGDLKAVTTSIPEGQAQAKSPRSIAVLPFVNISTDPSNEYFCDGLAEELLNSLAKIDALHVAARTSAFAFKGKDVNVIEIGRTLNVGAVLEGSVRKSGDRLRITAQLINVADGYHLWSERYDRQMQDIFDVQDEIALAIVQALKMKLLGEERAAVLKRYTDDTEAYQLYLLGRFHFLKFKEKAWRKAVEYFEQAVAKDPDYAPAFTGIAIARLYLWFFCAVLGENVTQMQAAAAKALAIDDTLAESHLTQGRLTLYHQWDWSAAEREFLRALDLDPKNAEAHVHYGLFLAATGRPGEAVSRARRTLELEPLSLFANLEVAWVFWYAGRHDLVIEQGRKLLELDPNFFAGHTITRIGLWLQGRHHDAIAAYEQAVARGAGALVLADLACLYGIVGQGEKAQQALEQLHAREKEEGVSGQAFAMAFAGVGQWDRAFDRLEQSYRRRDGFLVHFKHMAMLVPGFYEDPRFADLLRRMGLPE